ncbi:MAG: hypothetical protein IJF83_12420 [Methanobrevibacter sp.]|nr:hypothetical protein [Methanobrevibacter sp.]
MDLDKLARAACSFFVPGLGQLIKGEIGRGLKFLIGFIIIWLALLFIKVIIVQTIVGIILRVFSAYDAYTHIVTD